MVASMYVFNAFWMRFLPQFQPAFTDFEQAALVYGQLQDNMDQKCFLGIKFSTFLNQCLCAIII